MTDRARVHITPRELFVASDSARVLESIDSVQTHARHHSQPRAGAGLAEIAGYEPSIMQIEAFKRLGCRMFMAIVAF
ncbi:hypothetical protein RAS12_03120 [Achromobacter seleniivolatilans]|uniref:Uncharacterized protein n=1 Tax=Achromobacter seleniivolatilans TaxID=3047478 RepID=A0ABY9M5B4_9BURK|nr:hypothetical protein [Achromobacter sp. R39]WMD21373.1 hypothetical protein RAS12_03120 [Achromobacter sp. R39]